MKNRRDLVKFVKKTMRFLIFGDIVGQSGSRAVFLNLKTMKKTTKSDVVIVNGENAAEGRGITPEIMEQLFGLGVDVITTGNHIGQRKEIFPLLERNDRILRPGNYPSTVPGKGFTLIEHNGVSIGVVNLQGTVNLDNLNCPFKAAKDILDKLRNKTKIILIDFHAEWPEEKEALTIYLDGKVSAIFGTHTHVQTADERIFPGGTAYITDVGMTGPFESVIGMKKDIAIQKSLTMMPLKMEVSESQAIIMAITVDVDIETGKAVAINRIYEKSLL